MYFACSPQPDTLCGTVPLGRCSNGTEVMGGKVSGQNSSPQTLLVLAERARWPGKWVDQCGSAMEALWWWANKIMPKKAISWLLSPPTSTPRWGTTACIVGFVRLSDAVALQRRI